MDQAFLQTEYKGVELECLNRVRIYMQVAFLSGNSNTSSSLQRIAVENFISDVVCEIQ